MTGNGTATFDFTGCCVIVTGGSRGVGAGIVRAFLAAGADVVTCGRHEPAPDVLAELSEMGPDGVVRSAVFHVADVREPEQAAQLVAHATAQFGRLDVLVNNAGGGPVADAATVSPRLVAAIVSLNLLAPFNCAQAANAVFQTQATGGTIVNVGSVSGIRPSPGSAAYGAAKAGLISLTQSLAVEWAPKVRINCVTAGLLDSGAGPEHYGGSEGMARVAATVPLGRVGTPDDVSGLCLFLASPLSSYVTGANLVAHGGGEWPAFLQAAKG